MVRGAIIGVLVLAGLYLLDHLPRLWTDLAPPSDMATLDEFLAWKNDGISGEGIFIHEEGSFTVMMGEMGAFLASGPAAYVFTSDGAFVDWTPDMGDVPTRKHRFKLMSGNVISTESK